MRDDAVAGATTDDAVLGGRIALRQPRRGHRVGHDAILLAAATGAAGGEQAVDLGAGVGAAGIVLAARVPDLVVTLVEIDAALSELAAENVRRNGLADRVRAVTLDVAASPRSFAASGLPERCAARVLMNPPFNDPARHSRSPHPGRSAAHLAIAGLRPWLKTAARLLEPHGTVTLIWRADALGHVLRSLDDDFGSVVLLPVHPRPGEAAIRILARAAKGGRAPTMMLEGITLADESGRPSEAAQAVLRHGETLALATI